MKRLRQSVCCSTTPWITMCTSERAGGEGGCISERLRHSRAILSGYSARDGHALSITRAGTSLLTHWYPAKKTFCVLSHRAAFPGLLSVTGVKGDTVQNFASDQNTHSATGRRKWIVYLASAIGASISGFLGYIQYRRHSIRRRGVALVSISNFTYQNVAPFGRYKGILISIPQLDNIEKAEDFPVREDDVFVVSFPRSGTTWTQELVYLIANDADTALAKARSLEERFPYLEKHNCPIEDLNEMPSPRFIKSHLPHRLLPQALRKGKAKIIYVTRNPKDMLVSFFHIWQKFRQRYRGSFEEFCELFFKDELLFSPWLEHVGGFWERRDQDNVLFLKYEDMQKDLKGEVQRIAEFLNKPLTDKQVAVIMDHCSFDSMKQNDMVNYHWWDQAGMTSNMGTDFMRKGTVGDWRNYFTPELNERMDGKINESLVNIGLKVDYEIDS